jgi:hypothetical protein
VTPQRGARFPRFEAEVAAGEPEPAADQAGAVVAPGARREDGCDMDDLSR